MHANLTDALPESVQMYLSDGGIKNAVNHLTSGKDEHLPIGLEFKDYENFLAARAAAHLTRAEYPLAVFRVWQRVWGEVLNDQWQPKSREWNKQKNMGPDSIWRDEEIVLIHYNETAKAVLYTMVGLEGDKTYLGFDLNLNGASKISQDEGRFKWHQEGKSELFNDYMVASWEKPITDSEFPTNEFFAARDHAWRMIKECTTLRNDALP